VAEGRNIRAGDNHNLLSNRTVGDPHPQYAKRSGGTITGGMTVGCPFIVAGDSSWLGVPETGKGCVEFRNSSGDVHYRYFNQDTSLPIGVLQYGHTFVGNVSIETSLGSGQFHTIGGTLTGGSAYFNAGESVGFSIGAGAATYLALTGAATVFYPGARRNLNLSDSHDLTVQAATRMIGSFRVSSKTITLEGQLMSEDVDILGKSIVKMESEGVGEFNEVWLHEFVGDTYTDITTDAQTPGGSRDIYLNDDDWVYVGYDKPFEGVRFTLTTLPSGNVWGGSMSVQISVGHPTGWGSSGSGAAWVDGTNLLQQDGDVTWLNFGVGASSHFPPIVTTHPWNLQAPDAGTNPAPPGGSQYWMRIRRDQPAGITLPAIGQIQVLPSRPEIHSMLADTLLAAGDDNILIDLINSGDSDILFKDDSLGEFVFPAVLLETTGPVYTDITAEAKSSTVDVSMYVANGDAVLVGSPTPFGGIRFAHNTLASASITPLIQYSTNGVPAFRTFGSFLGSPATDGTVGHTQDGDITWVRKDVHDVLSALNWESATIDGKDMYWVRIERQNASGITVPIEDNMSMLTFADDRVLTGAGDWSLAQNDTTRAWYDKFATSDSDTVNAGRWRLM